MSKDKTFYKETASGIMMDFNNPQSGTVNIEDMAWSLSGLNRYTGAGKFVKGYSVAQHSVLISWWLRDNGYNWDIQLEGLLHDAHEAYMGDIVTPLKRAIPAIADFELVFQTWVRSELGMAAQFADLVEECDRRIVYDESKALLPIPFGSHPNGPLNVDIDEWDRLDAYKTFKETYYRLVNSTQERKKEDRRNISSRKKSQGPNSATMGG